MNRASHWSRRLVLGCVVFGGTRTGNTELRNQVDFKKIIFFGQSDYPRRVHTITKKHYIPESNFIYQKALRKHMQGGIGMPCGLLFYVCWIIKM